MIYKLIMNSSYGRNLMKAVEHETHMFYKQKDYEIFESRNYNLIYESTCFGKNCNKIKTYNTGIYAYMEFLRDRSSEF